MTLRTVTGTHISHSSFSPRSSYPLLFNPLTRNGNKRTTMACSKSPKDSDFFKRTAILFVGISVLPLIQLKDKSLESLAIEEGETDALEEEREQETPPDIFSLPDGLRIICAGKLGALYALARNENFSYKVTIESLENKLKKSEEGIVSLEKAYDLMLENERDKLNTKLKEAKEENRVSYGKLYAVLHRIAVKSRELENMPKLVDDLNKQIQSLQAQLEKAGEINKELEEKLNEKLKFIEVLQEKLALLGSDIEVKEDSIHDLESTVAQKHLDLVKLNSTYKQIKDEIAESNSASASLRQGILEKQKQLSEKITVVDYLNAQVSLLIALKDDLYKQLDRACRGYDDLKESSEEKSAMDAKFLGEKELEIHQLKEKIDVKSKELNKNKVLVSDLIQERDEMKKALNIEMKKVEMLKQELRSTEELLEKSRNEVTDLEKQTEM